jgi:hypothetical protein
MRLTTGGRTDLPAREVNFPRQECSAFLRYSPLSTLLFCGHPRQPWVEDIWPMSQLHTDMGMHLHPCVPGRRIVHPKPRERVCVC